MTRDMRFFVPVLCTYCIELALVGVGLYLGLLLRGGRGHGLVLGLLVREVGLLPVREAVVDETGPPEPGDLVDHAAHVAASPGRRRPHVLHRVTEGNRAVGTFPAVVLVCVVGVF
jgi:hypothetical protein